VSATRDRLLAALCALRRESIEVDGVGTVLVRELSVRERDEFVERVRDKPAGLASWVTSIACVDEDGAGLLSEADVQTLQHGRPGLIDAIARKALILSGLAKDQAVSPEPDGEPAAGEA
jgi:hypothetical protein